LDWQDTYILDIHSGSSAKFSAAVLPLHVRVIMADLIASYAANMQKKLQGDRVYGYKFQNHERASQFWTIDAFGDGYDKKGDDGPCSNGEITEKPNLPDGWNNDPNTSYPGPLSVFTAGGEGMYECLTSVGRYFMGCLG
jgi:hypothetical protein